MLLQETLCWKLHAVSDTHIETASKETDKASKTFMDFLTDVAAHWDLSMMTILTRLLGLQPSRPKLPDVELIDLHDNVWLTWSHVGSWSHKKNTTSMHIQTLM